MIRALGKRWRRPEKKRVISLDVESMENADLVLHVTVESREGRDSSYQMVLRDHGGDKWLVEYFDVTVGPVVPSLCDYPPPPRVN